MVEPSSLRALKEAHVAGLTGTTLLEVSAVAAVPSAMLLALRSLAALPQQGGAPLPPSAQQALEWLAFVPPLLAVQLDLITAPALLLAVAAALCSLWTLQRQPLRFSSPQPLLQQLRDAITLFRASLALITCVAILAVDFHAFPRRFGKAETFGTGLMDAGVGCFVLASAIPAGLGVASRGPGEPHSAGAPRKRLIRTGVLVALGLGRAASTHSLDYQSHAGEYGVHWNFFLTLAVLQLAGALLAGAMRSGVTSAGLGAALLALHQWLLSRWGLIEYVHAAGPRSGLVEANKEGLLSLPGYLALHWLGVALGQALGWLALAAGAGGVLHSAGEQQQQQEQQRRSKPPLASPAGQLLLCVAALDAALWVAVWAACRHVQPVSRRACNLPYVLWMLALSVQGVGLFLAAGWWHPGPVPLLLQRINAHMLSVFLAANLLTGLVNLSCDTLAVGWWGAAGILLVYMAAVCCSGGVWAALGRRLPRRRAV